MVVHDLMGKPRDVYIYMYNTLYVYIYMCVCVIEWQWIYPSMGFSSTKWETFQLPCLITGGKAIKNEEDILNYSVYPDGYWNVIIGLVAALRGSQIRDFTRAFTGYLVG